jgi:uncharacterized protein (TIGR00297 family)
MAQDYLILSLIISSTMFLTVRMRKLTLQAAIAGGCVGLLIFIGAGFTGIAMIATFFILGTAATSWNSKAKTMLGIAEENEGRRTAGQVLANAGVAAILGIYIYLLPEQTHTLRLMMASGVSAATADTLSSELGNVYGSRYYNIISFKKDQRGLNGVISAEGTLAGIIGSTFIAIIYSIGFGWNLNFLLIIIAGTIGNFADSILGATVERKRYLDNNAVNFINTSVGAIIAGLLTSFF